MIIYHVQYWHQQTDNDDCIHAAIKDLGFFLERSMAQKAALDYCYHDEKQLDPANITISEIPVDTSAILD